MLNEKVIQQLVERFVERVEVGNTYAMKKIAESIKKIGTLSPTEAQRLGQIMKFGGDYEKIVNELAKITELNKKEIYEVFNEVAKKNYAFAEQFYNYRGIGYIPYEQNIPLQNMVNALADITANEFTNLSKTNAIGFNVKDIDGNIIFKDYGTTYRDTIDKAVISVAQGKTTFDNEVYRMLKEIGDSGVKTLDYESGRSMRLDSAMRMNMQSALRNLHNVTQQQFGKEYDADGVEISVHINPALDHSIAQGRQFSTIKPSDGGLSEWEKLQTTGVATDYTGEEIDIHGYTKKGRSRSFRPISEYNCYHYVFAVVLGVQSPEYSQEQLNKINAKNEEGFEYEGKHYTNYQGEQVQRKLELEIRKAKDNQIMAKASGSQKLLQKSQARINALTERYNEFSKVSGLGRKADNLRVSGYRKVKINVL